MMWFCHGWGWQPPQTASHIQIRHIQSVCTHWYAVHRHMVAALHSYPPYLAQILGFWVTCGVKMMSLCHGWGWQPPQTASLIHLRHLQSVWAHWCAVHWHTVAALHSFTHSNKLRFWCSGSLVVVESKWCHYVMFEADSQLKLLPSSILDIYKVFEHIDMLSICTVNWHTVAALNSYTHTPWCKHASSTGATMPVQQRQQRPCNVRARRSSK